MNDKLWSFIRENIGKFVETDGVHWAQCVDLTKAWFLALGLPAYRGNAYEYGRGFHPEALEWIVNQPFNFPNPGDIVVVRGWNYVHVGICTSANRLTFDMFHQNYPVGSPATIGRFNYLAPRALGWLRPR